MNMDTPSITHSSDTMAEKKTIIAVVAVVIVIVAAVAVYFAFFNNGSSDDETYYFYVNYGDNDTKTSWYSAKGTDVDDALSKAFKGTDVTLSYGKSGYPNFDSGMWGVYAYVWSVCSPTTATESIVAPSYDGWGGFIKSNGWESFSGYGSGSQKMYQSCSNVFYFAKYDATTYDIMDPTESVLWQTAGGKNPFTSNVTFNDKKDYYFYINFGDDNILTGWYTAKAKDADSALAAAIKGTDISLTYSHGYPNFNLGMWGVYAYEWSSTTTEARNNSVSSPNYDGWGGFIKSNGWDSYAGFGDEEKKMYQADSTIFYFAMYNSVTYAIDDPTEDLLWQTGSGDNPFAKQ